MTCTVWKIFASGSSPWKCKSLFITENQDKSTELSLYMLYIRSSLEENARDDEKENQEIKNMGEKNKTRVKRKRLGKCDLQGKTQGGEILHS